MGSAHIFYDFHRNKSDLVPILCIITSFSVVFNEVKMAVQTTVKSFYRKILGKQISFASHLNVGVRPGEGSLTLQNHLKQGLK